MKNGKIEVEVLEGGSFSCDVCGERHDEWWPIWGYGHGHDAEGSNEINVCEHCIRVGDIDSRLKQCAAELQNKAAWLLGLVGKLKMPTVAELEECKQAKEELNASIKDLQNRLSDAESERNERNGDWGTSWSWTKTKSKGRATHEAEAWSTLCDVLNTPAAEITAPEVGA